MSKRPNLGSAGLMAAVAPLAGAIFPDTLRMAERWGALQMLAPKETLDAIQIIGRYSQYVSTSGLIDWALPVYRRSYATREEVMRLIDVLPTPKAPDLIAVYRSGEDIGVEVIDSAIQATATALSS